MSLLDSSISRQFDRLPPNAIEAEMCLLASMMLDVSRDTLGEVLQIVDENAFFQADHSVLFKVLKQLYELNRPIDAIIVREKALLRQLIAAGNDIIREAYSPHESAELVVENAEKKIFAIAEKK